MKQPIYTAVRKEDLPVEKTDPRLIASGFPSASDDYGNKKLNLHELLVSNASSTFFMRVFGNDQEEARIFDGDLLVIDRSKTVLSGSRVVAIVKEELVVGTIEKEKGSLFFTCGNKKISFSSDIIIWGVITYIISPQTPEGGIKKQFK